MRSAEKPILQSPGQEIKNSRDAKGHEGYELPQRTNGGALISATEVVMVGLRREEEERRGEGCARKKTFWAQRFAERRPQ